MARIRTIKPEFFTSEDIVELEPMARLLYIALWCEADKEGRLAWKPRTFKMRYLPADDCDIDALCDALVTRGLVVLYASGLAYIPSFKSHQHINPREKDSDLPDPNDASSRVSDASSLVQTRDSDAQGGREGKGKEGKGNIDRRVEDASAPNASEKKSRKKPRQQISEGYRFSERARSYGSKIGFSASEIDREEQRFIRHAKQNARICADWDMAAENWLDKAAEYAGKPPPQSEEAAEALAKMFYAKADSPQLAAWDAHSMAVRGRGISRDKNGGWYVESEWPSGYAPPGELRELSELPGLRPMQ